MIYKAPKSQKEQGRIRWWTLGGRKGWLKVVGLEVTSEGSQGLTLTNLRS